MQGRDNRAPFLVRLVSSMDAPGCWTVLLKLLVHLEILVGFAPLGDGLCERCFPDGAVLLHHFDGLLYFFCGTSLGRDGLLGDWLGCLFDGFRFSNGFGG